MSLVITPRSDWTTTAKGFPRFAGRAFVPAAVRGIAVHWPGDGAKSRAGLTKAQVAGLLRAYRNYHVGTRGWADIGYNYGIDLSGRVWDLAGDTHAAAHAASASNPNANSEYIGVLLLLGTEDKPSTAMIESFKKLRARLRQRFTKASTVLGHGSVPGATTSCPGAAARASIAAGDFTKSATTAVPKAPSTPKWNGNGRDANGSFRRGVVPGTKVTVVGDGGFGAFTIRALQSRLGVKVTGAWNKATITAYQRFLIRKGFRNHKADGVFGPFSVLSEQQWLRKEGYGFHSVDRDRGRFTIISLQHALIDGKVA